MWWHKSDRDVVALGPSCLVLWSPRIVARATVHSSLVRGRKSAGDADAVLNLKRRYGPCPRPALTPDPSLRRVAVRSRFDVPPGSSLSRCSARRRHPTDEVGRPPDSSGNGDAGSPHGQEMDPGRPRRPGSQGTCGARRGRPGCVCADRAPRSDRDNLSPGGCPGDIMSFEFDPHYCETFAKFDG